MTQSLKLAADSAGLASPNPPVGCVIVRDGQVVGEGCHIDDALDHAAVRALRNASADAAQKCRILSSFHAGPDLILEAYPSYSRSILSPWHS